MIGGDTVTLKRVPSCLHAEAAPPISFHASNTSSKMMHRTANDPTPAVQPRHNDQGAAAPQRQPGRWGRAGAPGPLRGLWLAASLTLGAQASWAAEEKPLWELGLGVATVSFPAYRGSDQSNSLVLPAPYLIYRGEFLKSDRHGVRGQLFDSERVDLSISAALSPPAASQEIVARKGMPDLAANFEIGPQLDLTLWQNQPRSRQLHLLLPARAAFTLTDRPESIGWVFHPKLNLDITDLAAMPGWNLGLQIGPLFGDQRQHAYFYGVDAAYATASRPAYQASGGYAGMQTLMALSKRYPGYWVGAFVRYDNLQGASFAASPLVRTQQYFAAGVAVSWMLGESSTRMMTND